VIAGEKNSFEALSNGRSAAKPLFDGMPEAAESLSRATASPYVSGGVARDFLTPVCSGEGEKQIPSFLVLGVRVHAVQIAETVERLCSWIENPHKTTRYVAVTGMHGIAESRQASHFRRILNTADLVVPDGMPLVWLGRMQGFPLHERVCGSDLMDNFCRVTGNAYRHFFYGGAPGVAEKLARLLQEKHGIVVAGTYTPPFRTLTDVEEKELASLVAEASPDVFWVGLSTPKQEKWMYEHRHKFKVPVMLGIGAAFDINCGNLRRAPAWMGEHGLEWLFRLVSEPRRLWKRYLITIPQAVWFVCMELLPIRAKRESV